MRTFTRPLLTVLLPLVICGSATAQDISPGMWEIMMVSKVPASPGFAPEPFRLNQCLTAADARDPSRLLGGMATPGATGCTYGDASRSGNTLHFTMQCSGTLNLRAQGDVNFTPDTISGTVNTTSDLAGQKVEMQSRIAARRIGGC